MLLLHFRPPLGFGPSALFSTTYCTKYARCSVFLPCKLMQKCRFSLLPRNNMYKGHITRVQKAFYPCYYLFPGVFPTSYLVSVKLKKKKACCCKYYSFGIIIRERKRSQDEDVLRPLQLLVFSLLLLLIHMNFYFLSSSSSL